MNFINSFKKINFSFFLFLVVLLCIVSITFGTISSSANSNDNQQTQQDNSQSDGTASFSESDNPLNFLTKSLDFFSRNSANSPLEVNDAIAVTNLNDSGDGSLRKAVIFANFTRGDDVITFDPALTGTIVLTTGELSVSSNITITGNSNIVVSGNNNSRIFNIATDSTLIISNLAITNGKVEGSGGGILNAGTLNLTNSRVSDNTSTYTKAASGTANGGGIYNTGTLTIQTTTLSNNTVSVTSLGTAGGGGLSNVGTATINSSSIVSNNSVGTPNANGGGISNNGTLTLINSTVGNNAASASSTNSTGRGGGLYNGAQGNLTVRNSTVGYNTTDALTAEGGGIFNASGGSTKISNTIVSNSNSISNATNGKRDVTGVVTSEGNNLISNSSDSTGWVASDILNQPSLITLLGNYGGSTQTFALLPTSPAINNGNNTNAPASDQRGSARIVGGVIDIGSFENNPAGVLAAISNGAVGVEYSQKLATVQPSTLTFAIVSGGLPPGINLATNGNLTGTPTTGGTFVFSVSITDANGFVNYKQYSIFIPFTIVNLDNSGNGSLRKAIADANASPGDDTISFKSGLTGTLILTGELAITSNITIVGSGFSNLTISGNDATRVFNIAANSNVSISGLTISNGKTEGVGAGILNAGTLGLSNVVIANDSAVYSGSAQGGAGGGGISNSGILTVTDSTIKNNTVQVFNLGTSSGGGLSNTGTATLTNSTVSSNSSLGKPNAYGGGISNNGILNIVNSTIGINTASASSATSGSPTGQGGGIWNGAQGMLTVRNTSIGFNSVTGTTVNGGGIFNSSGGTTKIGNTIVSDNSINSGTSITRDMSGVVTSEGNNLISNSSDSTGWVASDILNQPSLITLLGNYGGSTQTFALLPTSPAINNGNNTNAPASDQRGSARIVGGVIDIGSFENNPAGVLAAISNGAVGVEYSQKLATVQPSTLTFAIVSGGLPPGINLATNGNLTGTPTTGGTFVFSVSITDANGNVNFKDYALVITCSFAISSTSQNFTSAGGTGSVNVITQNGCFYTVNSNDSSAVTITSGSTGSGAGTVNFTVSANPGPARVATLTIAGITFTINQDSGCVYTLSPNSAAFSPSGGIGSFNVSTSSQCSWSATSDVSWITVNSGSGIGNGNVTYTVQANNGPARSGTITVGGQTYTVNQSSGCSIQISQPSTSFDASGGTGSFTVATTSICTYTAVSNMSWITINSGSSTSGNGTITFTVAANTGTARTGTITVGDQIFTINQAGGCVYTLSASSTNISETGGTGSVNVTAGSGCTWTAVSNVSWITITGGASGTGNGTVNFTVAANSGAPRVGTLTIAGQTFTVNQTGCAYTLSSSGTTFPAAGGSGSFNVTATGGCGWTAVTNVSWITIISGSGTGNGSVTFSVQANVGPPRTGIITVAGQTYTISQTDGCSYSIFPTSGNYPATAGTGSFNLNTGGGCQWTVVSGASWITITSATGGNGSSLITFSLQANTGQARSGTITIGGQTFTVNQAAAGTSVARPKFDFDGDGKADLSVFRPSNGVWYVQQSTNGFTGMQFGDVNDKIVPADYDGDGKTDIAVYRSGTWYLNRSTAGFIGIAFGASDDIPVPADFDGDGKAELAVWRPSNGNWYVYNLTSNSYTTTQFGATGDKPVVGDFDGDGKTDYAVYRTAIGTWYLQRSTAGFLGMQFGDTTDKPVPADFDGDGKTDLAVFRPSNGTWYLNRSTAGFTGIQFGVSTDLPIPADYDGDGKADVAVYRDGNWYLNRTTQGFLGIQFGAATDRPVPNAFVP